MSDNTESSASDVVKCTAAHDPAVRMFIGAAALLGVAIWCIVEQSKYPPPEAWDMPHINQAAGYALNHFGPWVFIPIALLLAAGAVMSLRRSILADAEGICINGKAKIPWGEFTGIDASLLERKGLLLLRRGDKPPVKLVHYKYRNFREMVAFIENRVKIET